ncbi:MAG TPA: hypothetical protein VGC09_23155 [Rhodopila sp.]
MTPRTVIHLFHSDKAQNDRPFGRLTTRLGSGHFVATERDEPAGADIDPYLLLILADQELLDGREDQARSLVEAAYACFDQKARSSAAGLHLAE